MKNLRECPNVLMLLQGVSADVDVVFVELLNLSYSVLIISALNHSALLNHITHYSLYNLPMAQTYEFAWLRSSLRMILN